MKTNKKIIVMFTLGMFILTTIHSFAKAAENKKNISLGVTDSGDPTIRWNKSENISFDFSPQIVYADDSFSKKHYTYGLGIGIIKKCKNNGPFQKGLAISLEYSYGYYNSKTYNATFGLGPDLEYFIPTLPNVSIGSQILLNYTYNEINNYYDDSGHLDRYSSISLSGQFLTIRYYF